MSRFATLTALVLFAIAAGCQPHEEKPPQSSLASTSEGVMCTKCQAVWVQTPRTEKGRIVEYSTSNQMVCPDCKDAVANFFDTGKLEHTCKTCGDSMEICKAH
jgi:hypothetical protein